MFLQKLWIALLFIVVSTLMGRFNVYVLPILNAHGNKLITLKKGLIVILYIYYPFGSFINSKDNRTL